MSRIPSEPVDVPQAAPTARPQVRVSAAEAANSNETPVAEKIDDAIPHVAAAESALQDFADTLTKQVVERPYTSLAVAAGVGYVLAAGTPNFLVKAVMGQGVKLATGMVIGAFAAPTE